MTFRLFPNPPVDPLVVAPGETSAPVEFSGAFGPGVGGRPTMVVRCAVWGSDGKPPQSPRLRVVLVRSGVAVDVSSREGVNPTRLAGGTAYASVFRSGRAGRGVFRVEVWAAAGLLAAQTWGIRFTNDGTIAAQIVWVVADGLAESRRPWIHVPQRTTGLPVPAPARLDVEVRNGGTGPLRLASEEGSTIAHGVVVGSVPPPLAPNGRDDIVLRFTETVPSGGLVVHDLPSSDPDARSDDVGSHNRRIRLSFASRSLGLLVTSQSNQTVRLYEETTGAFLRVAATGDLGDPLGIAIGLDGNVLVSDGTTNEVKRFDRETGTFLDVLASVGLAGPMGMTIHQGSLFVANSNPPQGVERFDATTGAHTGRFVPTLDNPSPRDVKVHTPSDRLYVLYYNHAAVEAFDLDTGASSGMLIAPGSGGLFTPMAMAFGPDGDLYVSGGSFGGGLGARRYDAGTGSFIGLFAGTESYPLGLCFGPDDNLYVATTGNNVLRFAHPSGEFVDFFVPDGGGDLTAPFHLTFG